MPTSESIGLENLKETVEFLELVTAERSLPDQSSVCHFAVVAIGRHEMARHVKDLALLVGAVGKLPALLLTNVGRRSRQTAL